MHTKRRSASTGLGLSGRILIYVGQWENDSLEILAMGAI